MAKLTIFLLLIIALTRISINKECSKSSSFSCPDDSLCCRGPSGWRCYSGMTTCCKNGLFACPSGTTCNDQTNKCDQV